MKTSAFDELERLVEDTRRRPDVGLQSPCIGTCRLGDDGLCVGCCRTRGEVAAWSGASNAERDRVLELCEARKAKRARDGG